VTLKEMRKLALALLRDPEVREELCAAVMCTSVTKCSFKTEKQECCLTYHHVNDGSPHLLRNR